MTNTEIHTLEAYFINEDNFASMLNAAKDGDSIAKRIWASLRDFLIHEPTADCAFCERRMSGDITFVVIMHDSDNASLTSVICEDCNERDDIDAQLKTVVQSWLPEADLVVVNHGNATKH
jgi:hypothetical protein